MIRKQRGFTLVELMVVVGVIAILVGLLLPALSIARRNALTLQDGAFQTEIHRAMITWSNGDEKQRMPTPGLVRRLAVNFGGGSPSAFVPGQGEEDKSANNSLNLWSLLIAKNYLVPATMVSPAETNPVVIVCDTYNYNIVNPTANPPVFWDTTGFRLALSSLPGDATSVAHCSFAHSVLAGQRKSYYWRSTADSSRAHIGNRAPYRGNIGGTSTYSAHLKSYSLSYTLRFHAPDDQWAGNVVYADSHTVFEKSMVPDQIQYECGNITLRKDNIYSHLEFVPCNPTGGPTGGAFGGGDNWMTLTDGTPLNNNNPPFVSEIKERLTNGDPSTGP